MQLKKIHQCRGSLVGDRLCQAGRNFGDGYDAMGNVVWFICGAGSKVSGFKPQQWVAQVDGKWFLRVLGNGDRGQYVSNKDGWSTQVVPASREQVDVFEAAVVLVRAQRGWIEELIVV